MTLGQRLKELRLSYNLTLRELAKQIETDFTYLSKIENDKTDHPPSEDFLKRISAYFNVDSDELIALSGQVPENFRKMITQDKEAFAFFRSAIANNFSGKDWAELKEYLKEKKKKREIY